MAVDISNAKTSVFWDVEDFPNPNGGSFYEIIKSALEKEGYRGEVSIKAYGEKKPDENLDGVIDFTPKRGKYARLNKMLVDIAILALDQPKSPSPCVPRNLMVIAKNIPVDTQFKAQLHLMATFHYNVILVVAPDCTHAPLPTVRTIWFWESLLDGREPLKSTERLSLLSRAKRFPFGSHPRVFDDDGIACPCGRKNCGLVAGQ